MHLKLVPYADNFDYEADYVQDQFHNGLSCAALGSPFVVKSSGLWVYQ